jgi:hypothetical protein
VPSRGAHQILGIITFAWVIVQGVLGVASKIVWETEFERSAIMPAPRFFPNTVHAISGYCIPILGFATVFLGILDWGINRAWMGLWGGWIGVIVVAFVVAEVLRRRREKYSHEERFVEKEVPLTKLSRSFRSRPSSVPTLVMVTQEPDVGVSPDGEVPDNTEEAYEDSETRWFADLSTTPTTSMHVGSEGMTPVARVSSFPTDRGSIRSSVAMSSGRGFDELAKEADGDPVSTEESSVATPRNATNSPRYPVRISMDAPPAVATSRSTTVSELLEIEAVSAMARRELRAMESSLSKYDTAPPAP